MTSNKDYFFSFHRCLPLKCVMAAKRFLDKYLKEPTQTVWVPVVKPCQPVVAAHTTSVNISYDFMQGVNRDNCEDFLNVSRESFMDVPLNESFSDLPTADSFRGICLDQSYLELPYGEAFPELPVNKTYYELPLWKFS